MDKLIGSKRVSTCSYDLRAHQSKCNSKDHGLTYRLRITYAQAVDDCYGKPKVQVLG